MYVKTQWVNNTTPINDTNLNKIEQGIYDNSENIDTLQTQITAIASGSPLVASSVSEMTDTTRVYVNTTDGHWYYYNGNEWADGGIYQASENSTALNDLKNFVDSYAWTSKNLFDYDNPSNQIGYRLTTDGTVTPHGNYLTSDYINVHNYLNKYLTTNTSPAHACFYNQNKEFISYMENIKYNNNRKIPNNENVYFMRISFEKTPNKMVVVTDERLYTDPVYTDYGKHIYKDVKIEKLNDLYFGEEVTNVGNTEQTISIGKNATKTSQNANVAIGFNALKSIQESATESDNGKFNTAIGNHSLKSSISGDHNTSVGWSAMADSTIGKFNTAVGEDALIHNIDGNNNVAIGNRALQSAISGNSNTAIGNSAMFNSHNTTGNFNAAVGMYAGNTITGNYNTCVGSQSNVDENINKSTAIGCGAIAKKERQIVVGSTKNNSSHPNETILNGNIIILGTDFIFRKLIFNQDGSVSWQDVSNDYQNYL